jgi:hypothetical protein
MVRGDTGADVDRQIEAPQRRHVEPAMSRHASEAGNESHNRKHSGRRRVDDGIAPRRWEGMTDTGIRGLSDMTRYFGFAQRVNASSHRDTDLGVRGWTPSSAPNFNYLSNGERIGAKFVRTMSAMQASFKEVASGTLTCCG